MMALNECTDPTSFLKLVKLHTAMSSIKSYPRLQPTGLKCIKRILEQDGDINYQIPNTVLLKSHQSESVGRTILNRGFYCIDSQIFNLLLDYGADFTIKTPEGQTVIHDYYMNTISWMLRDEDYSPTLLSSVHKLGVDLVLSAYLQRQIAENPVDPNGFSHLHAACMTNKVEVVKFYLDNGASVQQTVNADSPIFAGYTPLHFATRFICLDVVKLLLQRGVKVDARDAKTKTLLHLIISTILSHKDGFFGEWEKCIDIAKEIIKNYKIQDAQFPLGLSHLHLPCIFNDSSMLEKHLNDVKDVNSAVNADSPICPGYTPLHFAAPFNLDNVKLLVAKGADITIKNAEGKTPLDLCIARYGIEDVRDILVRSTFKDVTLSNGKIKLTDLVHSMRSLSHFRTLLRDLGDANAHIPVDSTLWPGHTPLHLAIIFLGGRNEEQRKILIQVAEECLENGVDVQGLLDQTPLQFAFRRGCAEVLDLMLKRQRGTSKPADKSGPSLLHVACATGNHSLVEALLDQGADVNCKLGSAVNWYSCEPETQGCLSSRPRVVLRNGSRPLHVAVAVDDLETARLLLSRGADPQAQDAAGMSVIHRLLLSDAHGSRKLCNELLSSENLKECVAESFGLSHLHVACYVGHLDAVKRLLREPEPPVNGSPFKGDTPLRMAMNSYRDEESESFEVVRLLLQHGADLLADSERSRAPLLDVMTSFGNNGDYDFWHLFVAKIRSDEDLRGRLDERVPGLTDLHLACYGRDLGWIGELLTEGIDVNARIREDSAIWSGYTPMHVLMKRKSMDMEEPDDVLQLLLDHGADVTIPAGGHSNTPLHLANYWSSPDADDCPSKVGIITEDCRGLHRVKKATLPHVPHDRASVMLRSIKDFTSNPTNMAGVSHFHIACWCLDVVAVEGFLKHGVDVNAKTDYFYEFMGGYTPLHVTLTREASSPRKMKIVDLLLKYGADLCAESYSGNTALHYAAMYHTNVGVPIFAMILEAGANINARNVLGATPFEILLKEGEVSVEWIERFIERGCRINVFNCVSDEGLIPMIFDARNLKKKDVKTLVLNSPNIGETDDMGRSAIHNIVSIFCLNKRDHIQSIPELWHRSSSCVRSPTMDEHDYAVLIEGLEELGCDVDHQDESGQTALHAAARFQNGRAISALLAAGADVNITDGAGKTAFDYSLLERRVYKGDWCGCRYERSEYVDVYSRHAVELFAAHARKLELAGLHVDALYERSKEIARNKTYSYRSMDENHFRAILGQVDNVKVGSQSLTLRDFVAANGPVWEYSKLRRMERKHVLELFDAILDKRYESKLGELRCLVKLQYRYYLARSKLVKAAKIALNVLANISVPELCSEMILAFCANWELKNVIGAAN